MLKGRALKFTSIFLLFLLLTHALQSCAQEEKRNSSVVSDGGDDSGNGDGSQTIQNGNGGQQTDDNGINVDNSNTQNSTGDGRVANPNDPGEFLPGTECELGCIQDCDASFTDPTELASCKQQCIENACATYPLAEQPGNLTSFTIPAGYEGHQVELTACTDSPVVINVDAGLHARSLQQPKLGLEFKRNKRWFNRVVGQIWNIVVTAVGGRSYFESPRNHAKQGGEFGRGQNCAADLKNTTKLKITPAGGELKNLMWYSAATTSYPLLEAIGLDRVEPGYPVFVKFGEPTGSVTFMFVTLNNHPGYDPNKPGAKGAQLEFFAEVYTSALQANTFTLKFEVFTKKRVSTD